MLRHIKGLAQCCQDTIARYLEFSVMAPKRAVRRLYLYMYSTNESPQKSSAMGTDFQRKGISVLNAPNVGDHAKLLHQEAL